MRAPFFIIVFLLFGRLTCYAQYFYVDATGHQAVVPLALNGSGVSVYSFFSGQEYYLLGVNNGNYSVSGGTIYNASTNFNFTKYASSGGVVGWGPHLSKIWGAYWNGGGSGDLYGNDVYDNKFSDANGGAFTGYGYDPTALHFQYRASICEGGNFGYYTAHPCTDTMSAKSFAVCPATGVGGGGGGGGIGGGGGAILAYAIGGSEGEQGFVTAIDVSLHPVWTDVLTDAPVRVCSILQDPVSTNIIVCGQRMVNGHLCIFLAGFDASTGDTTWDRSYTSSGSQMLETTPVQMIQLSNDSLYIAGNGAGPEGNISFALVTDHLGKVGWATAFGEGISRSISANATNDTSIVLAYSYIQAADTNILLSKVIRTDSVACFLYPLSFTQNNAGLGVILPRVGFGTGAYSTFTTIGASHATPTLSSTTLPFTEYSIECYGPDDEAGNPGTGVSIYWPGTPDCFCHGSSNKQPVQK